MMLQADNRSNSDIILNFKEGLLGFENIKKYKLLNIDNEIPFYFLREAETGHAQFIVCDPFFFVPEYKLSYDNEVRSELGAENDSDLKCLVIATVLDEFENMTVNLKSPVIFNVKNMLAKQFVLFDLDYPVRYKLFAAAGR